LAISLHRSVSLTLLKAFSDVAPQRDDDALRRERNKPTKISISRQFCNGLWNFLLAVKYTPLEEDSKRRFQLFTAGPRLRMA